MDNPEQSTDTNRATGFAGAVRYLTSWEIALGFVLTLVLVEVVLTWFVAPAPLRIAASGLYIALAILLIGLGDALPRSMGWANRITLIRAVLVVILTALSAFPAFLRTHPYAFITVALLALALDGVDGWVARRTRSVTSFGARFDMELDAFFILMLCGVLVSIEKVGLFVLWIGLARYLFVFAQRAVAWLRAELPDSVFRKGVCVWQVAMLLICLLPPVGAGLAASLLWLSLLLLVISFGRDIAWLYRHRQPYGNPR